MAKLISKRYADAFFDLAVEENKIDLFFDEANFVYKSISEDEKFMKVLVHPNIISEEKLLMLKNVFKDKISDEFISLFTLVLKKNRENELCSILEVFIDRVLDFKGITTAFVSSSSELSKSQLNAIKEKLSSNLNKQVNIEAVVDKSLIGGIKINVDGHVIDGTIKKKLSDLKDSLLNMQPAQ